jgi:hypothetical protein
MASVQKTSLHYLYEFVDGMIKREIEEYRREGLFKNKMIYQFKFLLN